MQCFSDPDIREYGFLDNQEPGSDVAASTKKNEIDLKWIITTILATIAVVGGSIWALHIEFSKITDRLGEIDRHIARVETAVRIVGAKQGGDTKTLIDEALTVAKN